MEYIKKYMSIDNGFKAHQRSLKQLTEEQKNEYVASYPTITLSINGINSTTGAKMEPVIKKKNNKGGFFLN